MHVLVVTPWFPAPRTPGAGVFNLRDVELLALDHEVTVLHLGGSGQRRTLQSGILVIPAPYDLKDPRTWVSARRAIQRELVGHDALHTMAFPALLPFAGLSVDVPWVHTEHWSGLVTSVADPAARIASKALRKMLRRPDAVVAVGAALAASVSAAGAESVSVIPNSVMSSPVLPPEPRADETLRLIGVGGLAEHKGQGIAIEAVNELVREGWDVRLTWVGEGTARVELEERIAHLQLEDRVELVGHAEPGQVSRLLSEHNAFVLPTAFETFGVAVAEALGHGLPVVVSGEGEHVNFVPERGARVVERSAVAFAEGIADIVRDPNRMSGAEISAYAAERFSTQARRDAYARVYGEAMRRHSAVD